MTIIDIIAQLRSLQRYDVVDAGEYAWIYEYSYGEFVRWDDVDKLIEALEKLKV